MALEGTHIRFAVDNQKLFEVEDVSKYISGTIYPDSRYPTGIDRTLTHDDSQMKKEFWVADDFKKGWATHLLYDKLQQQVYTEWFGDILVESNPEMTKEDDWIVRSALKILQDVDDIGKFDIKSHLSALDYVETPNGESRELIQRYNQLFVEIYQHSPNVTLEMLERMWIDWCVPPEIAKRMREKASELKNDNDVMKRIFCIYGETISHTEEFFSNYCL